MDARKPKGSGFMLLEVVLSVLIIGSGLLFVIRAYSTALRAQALASDMENACSLLEEKIFECDMAGVVEEGDKSGDFGEGYERYGWRRDAGPVDNKRYVNKVTICVFYGPDRVRRALTISTFYKNKES